MPIMYFESAKTNSALLSWFASWENLITLSLSGSKAELLTVSAMMIDQLQARINVSYYPLRTKTCFEIERITELYNKSYRALIFFLIAVILSRTTAAHSARSRQTFYERGKEKVERTRVEEIALAFLRIRMSFISGTCHVYFALVLNL